MAKTILVSGATGFIGRRVVARLLGAGHRVRAVSRRPPDRLDMPRRDRLEWVQADLLDPGSLAGHFQGVDAAFYLVHSMEGTIGQAGEFVDRDKTAAAHFARAAAGGAGRILYLSGLAPPDCRSAHLESRREVERILWAGRAPLTVLRAGFIIGAGSAGCVMLDAITAKMDALMVVPDFHHLTQPAYVDDVVAALMCCVCHPDETTDATFEVGSQQPVSYRDLIEAYGRAAGRRLELVDVPWAPRSFGATWISAISGLPYALVRALSDGLATDLLVDDESLYDICPVPRTAPRRAIRKAVAASQ